MELVPLWRQIDLDSLPSTWKDEAPDAQDQEEDVGKERRHVNGFAGRLDALDEASSHQEPGEEQGADRGESWGALQTSEPWHVQLRPVGFQQRNDYSTELSFLGF